MSLKYSNRPIACAHTSRHISFALVKSGRRGAKPFHVFRIFYPVKVHRVCKNVSGVPRKLPGDRCSRLIVMRDRNLLRFSDIRIHASESSRLKLCSTVSMGSFVERYLPYRSVSKFVMATSYD